MSFGAFLFFSQLFPQLSRRRRQLL